LHQAEILNTSARGLLCALQRENEPITNALPARTRYHLLGNGYSAALYFMHPRISSVPFHGIMLLRNSIPVAYGDVKLESKGTRANCSFNLFEPFRGAEGMHVYLQFLRAIHHSFRVSRFIIEPFQFGKDNEEGLRSGAFWFYYKLGFRPGKPSIASLAQSESEKMMQNRKYRSPIATMRKLATTNLYFRLQ
jgi:hypothetical protein